ncbi:alpha/beta fold hydrolase [Lichenicoccus roseus]|nr:alpha/beta fold hydrolase [Lichenicoccus roseus]
MTPRLRFENGWAMPAGVWDGVRAELARAGLPPSGGGAGATPVLAVGHSLGVLRLLLEPPPGMVGLVAINGFTRMTAGPDFPAGIDPRVLRRMAQRLSQEPGATVAAFRERCGWLSPRGGVEAPEVSSLAAGLRLLREGDGRAALAALRCPVLALAGSDDPIVTSAMTRDSFAGLQSLRWVEGGGHLLPLTHPGACADAIRDLLGVLR